MDVERTLRFLVEQARGLFFVTGAMGSGKTQLLIAVRDSFPASTLLTHSISCASVEAAGERDESDESAKGFVFSRNGDRALALRIEADDPHARRLEAALDACSEAANRSADSNKSASARAFLLVDEAQFCNAAQIDCLARRAKTGPVVCFGIASDVQARLFDGSKRLLGVGAILLHLRMQCACGEGWATMHRLDASVPQSPTTPVPDRETRVEKSVPTSEDGVYVNVEKENHYRSVCYACWEGP